MTTYTIQVSFDNRCRVYRQVAPGAPMQLLTIARGKDKADAVKQACRQVRLARQSKF